MTRSLPTLFLALFSALAFIPLIQLSSPGQDPMLIPFNIFLWCVVAVFIGSASVIIYRQNTLILPRFTVWLLALPAGLIASGFMTGIERPVDWLFRLGAILAGIGFFLALFQYRPTRRTLDNAIYALLGAMILNGIVSFLQLMPGRPLLGLIAHPERPSALGVFMQPNLQASIMATGLLLALYQMTSAGFKTRAKLLQALPPLAILICSASVMATGSRVGLIALMIALPLMLFARLPQLLPRKTLMATIATALILGCSAGTAMSDGLFRAYSKLERLAEEGKDARPHIYRIAWSLYTDKPVAGHGIGSFQNVFHQRAGEYMAERGSEPLIGHSRYSHPHNELLFWAIEGGSLALLGIALAAGAVLIQLWRLGRQRGLAYLALLVPLSLHTQVELPFYSSAYHWLIFLFLLFLVFQHGCRRIPLRLSRAASILIPSTGLALMTGMLVVMVSTFSASRHITAFMVYQDIDFEHLEKAQKNLYFNEFSQLLAFKTLLYSDLANKQHKWTRHYIEWAEKHLQSSPEVSTFHDLALAYNHIGDHENAMRIIHRGLFLFPRQELIISAKEKITKQYN